MTRRATEYEIERTSGLTNEQKGALRDAFRYGPRFVSHYGQQVVGDLFERELVYVHVHGGTFTITELGRTVAIEEVVR